METALGLMETLAGISIVRISATAYAMVSALHLLCLGLRQGAILPLDLGVQGASGPS